MGRKVDGVVQKMTEKISIRNAKHAKSGLLDMIDYVNDVSDNKFKNFVMVEIGCYVGDSTEIFAEHCDKIYCVDPWVNGYDDKDDSSFKYPMQIIEKQFNEMSSHYNNIVKYKMKSEEAVEMFENGMFDLVYIDALHTFDGVAKDIKLWKSKIRKGGFLTGHDYQRKFSGVIKAVNNFRQPNKTFLDTSWLIRL